mgnify:FL=1
MKILSLKHITRIEGHLNFTVTIKNGVVRARAEALEGTRLLERVFIGREYWEIPDIASRICGVCQAIHRLTAIQAIENAFDVLLPEELEKLRKLIAIGGHLQSHIVHLFIFVLPDYMESHSILEIASKSRRLVRNFLRMKKIANSITEMIGGRAVHPLTPVVGGLSKLPTRRVLELALDLAKEFMRLAKETLRPIFLLELPKFKRRTNYLSLYDGKEYPLLRGFIKIFGKEEFKPEDYEMYIKPITEDYSTARHYVLRDSSKDYVVGALSRVNINHSLLSDSAMEVIKEYNLRYPSYSPFENNRAQAVEIIHFAEDMVNTLEDLIHRPPRFKKVDFKVKEGEGVAATEAPRGLLIHHYKISREGTIEKANIITPTAQNYKSMEADAVAYTTKLLSEKISDIKGELEKLIRAYDPCVSCSARFFREHTFTRDSI